MESTIRHVNVLRVIKFKSNENHDLLVELLDELKNDMEKGNRGMKIWYDEEFAQLDAQHKKELAIKESQYKKELANMESRCEGEIRHMQLQHKKELAEKEKIHAIELATKDQKIAKLEALLKRCVLKNYCS